MWIEVWDVHSEDWQLINLEMIATLGKYHGSKIKDGTYGTTFGFRGGFFVNSSCDFDRIKKLVTKGTLLKRYK